MIIFFAFCYVSELLVYVVNALMVFLQNGNEDSFSLCIFRLLFTSYVL